MNQYLLIANNATTHESTSLGTVSANSIGEAALFLAYHFPDKYFLSNIIALDESGKQTDFMCIACKEAYEHSYADEGLPVPSPVEIATNYLMNNIMIANNMCDTYIDDGDTCHSAWKAVKSEDGNIVKDNRKEN